MSFGFGDNRYQVQLTSTGGSDSEQGCRASVEREAFTVETL